MRTAECRWGVRVCTYEREGHGMKFTVEREALAEAVTWVARALPSRPVIPVLAGLLLRADDGRA